MAQCAECGAALSPVLEVQQRHPMCWECRRIEGISLGDPSWVAVRTVCWGCRGTGLGEAEEGWDELAASPADEPLCPGCGGAGYLLAWGTVLA